NGGQSCTDPPDGGSASSPVVDEDSRSVLFGSEEYSFYSGDIRSGRINWSYRTEGRIRSTGQIAHGRVFFGSDDGHLYALMAATGRYLWKYDLGSEVQSSPFVTRSEEHTSELQSREKLVCRLALEKKC